MIPIITFFGCGLLFVWAILYPRTFFSVVWRIFLFVLLFYSIVLVWGYLPRPELDYRTPTLVVAAIGLIGSASGLVRSFFFKKA